MTRRWLAFGIALGSGWLVACGSPIVGAECRPGFVVCDGRCVDPQSDPAHCGGCGNDCGAFECREAMCGPGLRDGGPGPDGGALDAGVDGGTLDSGMRPPTTGKGNSGFPLRPDGGFMFPDPDVMSGCGIGETDCGGVCADLVRDPDHCGACGTRCGAEQFCAGGTCQDLCESPLRPCGGACVDFETDERHCGGCNIVCASGLCVDGECADAVPGHLVVIGHDYSSVQRRGRAQTIEWIAGNALFMARGAPVRALVYRGAVHDQSATRVHNAFEAVAAEIGRSFTASEVEADRVSAALAMADAFVIHAQRGASDEELVELGQRWGLSMAQFLLRGGTIVLFETESATNGGTYQLLEPSGLFTADSCEPVSGVLQVVEPGDGVATNTTREYQSQATTLRFSGVASGSIVVVEDETGAPVVIHRVALP